MSTSEKREFEERTLKMTDGRVLTFTCYLSDDQTRWIRHGSFREVSPSGVVLGEGTYLDGKESGEWTDRYENGVVAARGNYHQGEETGWWRFWSDDGTEEEPVHYRDGEPEDSKEESP